MIIAALFIIPNWEQQKCSSTSEWINKLYICSMEIYSVIQRKLYQSEFNQRSRTTKIFAGNVYVCIVICLQGFDVTQLNWLSNLDEAVVFTSSAGAWSSRGRQLGGEERYNMQETQTSWNLWGWTDIPMSLFNLDWWCGYPVGKVALSWHTLVPGIRGVERGSKER